MNDSALRDPTTVNCRIYVGNLKENTPKTELQNIFGKYGTIRGIMLSRNFGFIQFDTEPNANKAIDGENQKMYNGRKINVSKVQKKNQNQKLADNKTGSSATPSDAVPQQPPINPTTYAINPSETTNVTTLSANNNASNIGMVTNPPNANNHQQRPQWRNKNNNMNLNNDRERSPLDTRREPSSDRWKHDSGSSNFNNFRNNNNARNSNQNFDKAKSVLNGGVLQGYASAREIRAKYPNANDCEIVVLEKHLVDYAEFIEGRLKRLGITADLLFPNAELTIGKMLTNLSKRGSLFAVIIRPIHKENNSVTVNILYGIPAEHRNMPVEDAISLIFRNYQHLCQGENGDVIGDTDDSPYATIPLASTRHPDHMQHLLNLLADNRTLTVLQLDCVQKYLLERREIQYKFELGDANIELPTTTTAENSKPVISAALDAEASLVEPQPVDAEEEIKKKILEILNKPTIANIKPDASSVKAPEQKSSTGSSTANSDRIEPNLLAKDPNLRNVLDSIIFDDL